MEVNLRCGGCWNANAICMYTNAMDKNETRLAAKPGVTVIPGKITCPEYVEDQLSGDAFCSAQLTETQYWAADEAAPDAGQAYGSAAERIPGFRRVKPPGMVEGCVESVEVAGRGLLRGVRMFFGRR